MKVLIFSKINSIHTVRWANSIARRGIDVLVYGLENLKIQGYDFQYVRVESAGIQEKKFGVSISKAYYLLALPKLLSVISRFKPNILHVHYASSYGLMGVLSGYHPLIISVWGTDVYNFPKSNLNRKLLEFTLNRADAITSTSQVMAKEASKYTKNKIEVIPFGVDIHSFKPFNLRERSKDGSIVIGTVKSLEEKYGIDLLIKAFSILKAKYPQRNLHLTIVGGGSKEESLKKLARDLGVFDYINFTGPVNHSEISKYLNTFDVFVALSREESFGVAVVEAMACGLPVVVSNVGGLTEVVEDRITGFVVPSEDPDSAARAIERILADEDLRERMGKAGRERVERLYNWENNVSMMIGLYEKILSLGREP